MVSNYVYLSICIYVWMRMRKYLALTSLDMWKGVLASLLYISLVFGYVHPIIIHGHYFVDSVTKEPVS